MKITLVVLWIINVVSALFLFLLLLGEDLLLAFIFGAVLLFSMLPITALLRCMDQIDDLHDNVTRLRERVFQLERALDRSDAEPKETPDVSMQAFCSALGRWYCPKCKSVNRAKTAQCENCGAHYSPEFERLTDAPLTRWRLKKGKKKKK